MLAFNQKYQRFFTLVSRLVIGGVLLVAGGLKAFVPAEAAGAVAAYKILPTQIAHIVGYALPWFEIAIALLLIIGISVRMTSILAGAIMVLFIVAIASVWTRGILIDCGCFGGGGSIDPSKAAQVHRSYALEIARDLGLALLALYLYFFPYGFLSLDKSPPPNEEM